mgnify:CR=1 FL=1
MRPPRRDRFEDDPEGYERAWSHHEERMEDLRDYQRDEQAEREMIAAANERRDELTAKYAVEIAEERENQRRENEARKEFP